MSRQGRRRRQGLWDDVRVRGLSPEEQVRPAAFLRAGTVDAATLLVLRALRRAVWPLVVIGLAVAWVSGDLTNGAMSWLTDPTQLADPAALIGLILSPLVVFAAGVALRIIVNLTALAVAAPLAQGAWVAGTEAVSRGRRLIDLAYLSAGYRSVRWSYAVQREAVARCGMLGRQLAFVETLGRIALPVSIVVFVWIVYDSVSTGTAG
ncbi:hypothetical protein [Isoptericola sp. AK164]|uniref:hypothetical protein n=1 Tax=Isoptericola sp. AK164 TaxID=3024246 RepID=UPI0024182F52|nr:hypothetical protein [Isoptericola sp. AK164]